MTTLSTWELFSEGKHLRYPPQYGIYVVQFPDRIKIGKSDVMRSRIRQHRAGGAIRAAGYHVRDTHRAERIALRAMTSRADRIGWTESFRGISFVEAETVLVTVVRRINGDWPEAILTWGLTG